MQSGVNEARAQFIAVHTSSARALGEDVTLELDRGDNEYPLDLAAPAGALDQRLIRWFADSLALIRIHHDADLHAANAPDGVLARKIFVAMERVRCEACCNRH